MLTTLLLADPSSPSEGHGVSHSDPQDPCDTVVTSPEARTSVPATVSELSLPRPENSRGLQIQCGPCTEDGEKDCRRSRRKTQRTVSRNGTTFEVCATCFYKATKPETRRDTTRYPKYDLNFHPSSCGKNEVDRKRGVAIEKSRALGQVSKSREKKLEAERQQFGTLSADSLQNTNTS